MFFIVSKEERQIRKAISNIKSFLISELKNKGMVSLLLVGTIVSKKERNKTSDIDFFAIVEDDFDFGLEEVINKKLDDSMQDLCLGFEARVRCFHIDFLKGGKTKTRAQEFVPAARLVQRLPFYKVVWGKKFNYAEEFVKPMNLEDEARLLIKQATDSIYGIRQDKYWTSLHNFYKLVVELVRVEAQLYKGFKFHPDRHKLVNFLKREEQHILHKAMKLRNEFENKSKEEIKKDTLDLCDEVESYIEVFNSLLDKKQ